MPAQDSSAPRVLPHSPVEGCRDPGQRIPVLIVDDDPAASRLLSLFFDGTNFSSTIANNGAEALKLMERERFDAVISDLRMPGMTGLELLAETHLRFRYTAFLLTTGVDDLQVATNAMSSGADDYLVKPLSEEVVLSSLDRALRKRRREELLEDYRQNLETLVSERTEQLNRALQHVQASYEQTLRALGTAIDLRDHATAGHSWRVSGYSLEISAAMNVSEELRCNLARASHLHDIGKLGVPDRILLKPGPLTPQERDIMREHVTMGFDLLKRIPFLAAAADIVLCHHEHYDGNGYPRGISREEIPLGARIFSVADAFDAITSDRPYRSASTCVEARELISKQSGTQFDPEVVAAFLTIPLDRWQQIAQDRTSLSDANSPLLTQTCSPAAGI
jgi:response regulator RpfG family c-di-GMP phosphodiesterase